MISLQTLHFGHSEFGEIQKEETLHFPSCLLCPKFFSHLFSSRFSSFPFYYFLFSFRISFLFFSLLPYVSKQGLASPDACLTFGFFLKV